MTKLKLELKGMNTAQKIALDYNHITSRTGNTTYPAASRVPSDAKIQTLQDNLVPADAAAEVAETAWRQKVREREDAEAEWDLKMTARAGYCEAVTSGDASALASTGFPLRTAPLWLARCLRRATFVPPPRTTRARSSCAARK